LYVFNIQEFRMKACIHLLMTVTFLFGSAVAFAWSAPGHETVGSIADSLLDGTNAAKAVKSILGAETLETASVWADCAKGVTEKPPLKYVVDSRYTECKPFETATGEAQMVDFVTRNLSACKPAPGDESCHRQYHYADVAIERNTYSRSDIGTSDHDVVSAINAAIVVLQGGTSPAPISFTSKQEALRVLAHYVGDIHQPLHVGAIYLDAKGHEVDPDAGMYNPATKTQGGNKILDRGKDFHTTEWDAIPASLTAAKFKGGVAQAKLVKATPGPLNQWAAAWASDTVLASHTAFSGLVFGAENTSNGTWPVTEPTGYSAAKASLQKKQLVKAGARLAQVLRAIFP
jgi:S1/P1 Nuclease